MLELYLRHKYRRGTLFLIALAALAAGILAGLVHQPASAHERVEVGPYIIILGWRNEPVIVGERNALRIEVTLDGEPVEDLEGSINLTVFYGGRSFIGQLAPAGEPGVYTAEIYPTLRGQYEVNLAGTIGDESFDLILEPEEVLPGNVLQFPEAQPDPAEMHTQIEDLQSKIQQANTTALIGIGVGGIGLILGGLALFMSRRKS